MAIGLATVWRHKELRAITTGTCLAFVGIGGLTTTAVLLTENQNRPGTGGLLMTTFAAGALAGALTVARSRPAVSADLLAVIGMLGTGIGLAAAALAPAPLACAALFAVAGAGDGILLTATLRLRADHSPLHLRAQVFTIGAGLKISAAALGAAVAGLTASGSAKSVSPPSRWWRH
jgi:MFS family permease